MRLATEYGIIYAMNNEMEVFDFDRAVREQYALIVAGATMNMSDWEGEEPAAIRRILRSPDRARRFLARLDPLNRYVDEELASAPPSDKTHVLLNRMAKYYANCAIFCAIWLSRNALQAYLHDQKRRSGAPATTAEDILSATQDPNGILSALHSLYQILYNCPRDELVTDYRSVVEEFLEDYLDICLAVADDPEVRNLRDYLRDFFAYEYQPVFTRPLTRAEYDNLPAKKFDELAERWQAAVLSYAISFAQREDNRKLADEIRQMLKKEVENFLAFLRRRLWHLFQFKGTKKLTQQEVGTIFGVSAQVVSDWEAGRTKPPTSWDGKLVYRKDLRITGDNKALKEIAKRYIDRREYRDAYSTKDLVSFNEQYHRPVKNP